MRNTWLDCHLPWRIIAASIHNESGSWNPQIKSVEYGTLWADVDMPDLVFIAICDGTRFKIGRDFGKLVDGRNAGWNERIGRSLFIIGSMGFCILWAKDGLTRLIEAHHWKTYTNIFEEGVMLLWRGLCATLKRAVCYFEEGCVLLWRGWCGIIPPFYSKELQNVGFEELLLLEQIAEKIMDINFLVIQISTRYTLMLKHCTP